MEIRYVEDASGFRGHADRLFLPESGEQVAAVLGEAAASGTPVTIAGAGTGVTGGRVAQGGWVVSTERLRELRIHPGIAEAGAGVLLRDLHAAAARSRQTYAPDPTEWTASVGGTVATNASGSRSFRYGSTRAHVLALEVATMDGRLRRFARGDAIDFDVAAIPPPRTTKNTAGYALKPGMDWVDLFVGSEGTLGVVTRAELRLLPEPRDLFTGLVFFRGDESAIAAVDDWRGIAGLRMLEYFDRASLDLLRSAFPEIPAAGGAAILFEHEADDSAADAWLDRLDAADALTDASWFALTPVDRERLRRFRHALPEAVNEIVRRTGFTKLGSDYAVPIDRNLEMLRAYSDVLGAEFPGRHVVFGHIGDAHVHANILPATRAEFDHGREVMVDLARRAVALGGTVSAEHGLGKRKRHLLAVQFAPHQVESMMAVKRRLDPQWLLGRGTLFPAP
jgi:FAD/FMN-containing dehydrogenase